MNIRKILGLETVTHNISTNHTFDFQNFTIFAFIHDRDKHRIIKASLYLILIQFFKDKDFIRYHLL